MANLIDNAVDALETKLGELVEASVLKDVVRHIINPLISLSLPVCSLLPGAAERKGGEGDNATWIVPVLIMVCTRAKDSTCDQTITELVAEITGKIEALNAADAPGGVYDLVRWDFWYEREVTNVAVGAWGSLRIQLQGSLKVAE